MSIRVAAVAAGGAVLILSGCYGVHNRALPQGEAAYRVIPNPEQGLPRSAIHPGDRLSVRVLGEADLSSEQVWVDGDGRIQIPLAGEVTAAGHSPAEVREVIEQRLAARYVRDPQVAVTILEHAKQAITVEGEVQHAGLYEAPPGLTLIGALALAQSTTNNAALDEVVIFREIDGRRMGARFNLAEIRVGKAPDPQIVAGDTVVVGRSAVKSAWHDFLQAAPAFSIFYYLK